MLLSRLLTKSELKKMSFKERFFMLITTGQADFLFDDSVIDILIARDEKDNRIHDFVQSRDAAWRTYYTLKTLYETEYGEIPKEITETIEQRARELADHALEKFGWKGERK